MPSHPEVTTLALGEEGPFDPFDWLDHAPGMVTTFAIGEEGDPSPFPDPPEFTTLAIGEEGYPGFPDWSF